MKHKLKAYRFPIILLAAIIIGMIIGLIFGEKADVIKPLGDIFINLLFVVVVPLVFFSISSAIANMDNMKRLGKIFGSMITVRSEEHTSELQSRGHLVCRLLLEK